MAKAAVRISQLSGVRPGTLYAGTHLITALIERGQTYDIREKVFFDGRHRRSAR